MKNILIVSGHPDLAHSLANKTILDETASLFPAAEIALLDSLYPTFEIDVEKEQERLTRADIVVFQFPIMWYSSPSLLHRYVEKVFTYGFAYGAGGDQVKGKSLVLSFTSGSPAEAYSYDGAQHYPIDAFMPPFIGIASLCGMKWENYIYTGGMNTAGADTQAKADDIRHRAVEHARRLAEVLKSLQ